MMTPIVKRLVQSLSDELNAAALEAEQRLAKAGFPVRRGDSWLLHGDVICEALWSCRTKAEKVLSELTPGSAIGGVQYFLSGRNTLLSTGRKSFAMKPVLLFRRSSKQGRRGVLNEQGQ